MIDQRYVTLIEQLRMTSGSSWRSKDYSYVIVILDEIDNDNLEQQRQWCRVLKITPNSVIQDTMFWPYLIGLAKTEKIIAV